MNIHDPNISTPKVTTGPITGSRKIHTTPQAAPDLRVPLKEIALDPKSGEAPLPVYDTSGPYTDENATIDVEAGLPRARVAWVRERGGIEEYEGRPIKPVDNGNATGKYLARNFPNTPKPMRALDGKPMTQYEWAKAGIITKEMIYVAERENLGRKAQLDRAAAAQFARRRRHREPRPPPHRDDRVPRRDGCRRWRPRHRQQPGGAGHGRVSRDGPDGQHGAAAAGAGAREDRHR